MTIHFLDKSRESGLVFTGGSATLSFDEEKDDQELFDDFHDDTELEDSKLILPVTCLKDGLLVVWGMRAVGRVWRVVVGWGARSCTWVVNNSSCIGDVPLDMEGLLWSAEGCGECNDDVECITVGFIASDVIGRFRAELWVFVSLSSEMLTEDSDNIEFDAVYIVLVSSFELSILLSKVSKVYVFDI